MKRMLFLITCFFYACSIWNGESDEVAGTGTGTGNSISGKIYYPDSTLAQEVPVKLRSSNYLKTPGELAKAAADSLDDVTDSDGSFKLDSIESGSYLLEINDGSYGMALEIHFAPGTETEMDLKIALLKLNGTLTGTVLLPTGIQGPVFVQVFGLEYLAQVDPVTGEFVLENLPEGEYTIRASTSSPMLSAVDTSCMVISGETTSMPPLVLQDMNPQPGASISGTVLYPDSIPGSYLPVKVRRTNYLRNPRGVILPKLSADSYDTFTDSSGYFLVSGLDTGSYLLEINDGEYGLVHKVDIPQSDANINLDLLLLSLNGGVIGCVQSPGDRKDPVWVQVYGLDRIVKVDSISGDYSLPDLAQGEYILRFVSLAQDLQIQEVSIYIVSESVKDLEDVKLPELMSAWTDTASIFINTGPTGAGVSAPVPDFPLLLRLDSSNFDFTQAKDLGEDLRFTKLDGAPLQYEIERWDRNLEQAEIWIRIDTILGDNTNQQIQMYWGNPGAPSLSNARIVFDDDLDFKGVWHLNEAGPLADGSDVYINAANGYLGRDFVSSVLKDGVIGLGQEFDGIDDYIHINQFITELARDNFTISLWMNARDSGGAFLFKGDENGIFDLGEKVFYLGNGSNQTVGTNPVFVGHSNRWMIADTLLELNTWYHLALSWSFAERTFDYYINGAPVSVNIDDRYRPENGDNPDNTIFIGSPGHNDFMQFFNGFMDEIRLDGMVRSASWIKLCFENQKQGSTMLNISQ
jgi:hypothetical protein